MTHSVVTLAAQAQRWLADLALRRGNPVSPATLRTFSSYVRRLLPIVGGDTKLETINNGVAKSLVGELCSQGLAPNTVNELLGALKAIVVSAVDPDTGEQLFPRVWNSRHIDCPQVGKQRQPSVTTEQLEQAIKNARTDQERVLHCLLAGTGLRVAECLALRLNGTDKETSWNPASAIISVR